MSVIIDKNNTSSSAAAVAALADDTTADEPEEKTLLKTIETTKIIIPRKCRRILWFMVLTGFAIDAMVRVDTSLTIVDMINRKPIPHYNNIVDLNVTNLNNNNNDSTKNVLFNNISSSIIIESDNAIPVKKRFSFERLILDTLKIEYKKDGFGWDEYKQGIILGSFYYLNWLTQIFGGTLSRRYGTKKIFGLVNLCGGILSILIPICAFIDYRLLMLMRSLQGALYGMSLPAMHTMIGKWIPPNERSKFMTAYLGTSIGIAIFAPIFGFIISATTWEWAYYVCAFSGIIWYFCWQYFVYDSPGQHPHIHPLEREYIETSVGQSIQKQGTKLQATPWRDILTSRPVWIICLCQWGSIWSLSTISANCPTFFRMVHLFDLRSIGLFAGGAYLLKMIFAYSYSIWADKMLKNKKLTTTQLRRISGGILTIGQGTFVALIGFAGHSRLGAVIVYYIAIIIHGTITAGPVANIIDLSPNFAGIILGLSLSLAIMTGYITPIIAGYITLNNVQSIEKWQIVFGLSGAVSILCGIIYANFADGTLQKWNNKSSNNNNKIADDK